MTASRNAALAAILSLLVPGLGHWYAGQRGVAAAMFCIAAGMVGSVLAFRSPSTTVSMGIMYVIVAVSDAIDAARVVGGRASTFRDGARWQIVLLLLAIGPFALPLLWQSQRFSRPAKIGWSIAVVLVAVLFVMVLGALGPALEQVLGDSALIE